MTDNVFEVKIWLEERDEFTGELLFEQEVLRIVPTFSTL